MKSEQTSKYTRDLSHFITFLSRDRKIKIKIMLVLKVVQLGTLLIFSQNNLIRKVNLVKFDIPLPALRKYVY